MLTLRDVPKLPRQGLLGHVGTSTQEQLVFQRSLCDIEAPLVQGRVLHMPLLVPCTPQAVHEVLVTKGKSFEKTPGLRVLFHFLAGKGLFTSEGPLWRRQRKLMSPIFQPAPIAEYAEIMRGVANKAADRMADGQTVDIARETMRIAMAVVGRALFEMETDDEADELGAALTLALSWVNEHSMSPALVAHVLTLDATDTLASKTSGQLRDALLRLHQKAEAPVLLPGSRAPALLDAVHKLDVLLQQIIDDRRRKGLTGKDLLTRLLLAREEDRDGSSMSDKQVRDEAVTLFVAGHETTANALAWSFYLLSRDPESLARARAEADAFGDGPIKHWEPARLAFCTRVFREALRMYPPLTILPRRTLEDVELCGYLIPKRTITMVSTYAIHHRSSVYECPDKFDPDRWLEEREARRHKSAFLPFGAGPRFCIGVHFAMMEGPIVLATLLRRWRFERNAEQTIEWDNFATLRPRGGVPMQVRSRN